VQFAMRLLAQIGPSTTNPGGADSIANGSRVFSMVGCALCHTPALETAPSVVTPA